MLCLSCCLCTNLTHILCGLTVPRSTTSTRALVLYLVVDIVLVLDVDIVLDIVLVAVPPVTARCETKTSPSGHNAVCKEN
jgi:hypothetical protein